MKEKRMASPEILRLIWHHKKIKDIEAKLKHTKEVYDELESRRLQKEARRARKGICEERESSIAC